MRRTGIAVVLVMVSAGCGGPASSSVPPANEEGGRDAGQTYDAGATDADAGGMPSQPLKDAGPDADAGMAPDGAAHLDAGTDAAVNDEPDDQGLDTNGDGVDGMVGRDVYVTLSGLDTSPGTPTQPMRSVAAAIALAQGRGGSVLLSAGTYTVAAITVAMPWAIYGGYDASFAGPPSRDRTMFEVDASGLVLSGASSARLTHVTVIAASASDSAQRSSHGIRSSVDTLWLDDVVVIAGDGKPGAAGNEGASGDTTGAAKPGLPGVTTAVSARLEGGKGLVCSGVAEPAFTNGGNGNGPSSDQKPAGTALGTPGNNGTPGANGLPTPLLVGGFVAWGPGGDGIDDATAGFGGAGGSDAVVMNGRVLSYQVCGGGGGTGGCPGKPGYGAEGGGGSIGLLVLSGQVTIARSRMQTGLGGNGGKGGLGGQHGQGGAGGQPSLCVLGGTNPKFPDTSYGGQGGWGGVGGAGGGAAGGWTVGVMTAHGARAVVDALTQYQLGTPGFGGSGDNGNAPAGQKKPIYAF